MTKVLVMHLELPDNTTEEEVARLAGCGFKAIADAYGHRKDFLLARKCLWGSLSDLEPIGIKPADVEAVVSRRIPALV